VGLLDGRSLGAATVAGHVDAYPLLAARARGRTARAGSLAALRRPAVTVVPTALKVCVGLRYLLAYPWAYQTWQEVRGHGS